jgi:probable rRNA maturation factor
MKKAKIEFCHFPGEASSLLKRSARAVLETKRGNSGAQICVTMIPDARIKKINRKYRNVDRITDVISFRLSKKPLCGDIYIASGRSKKQAKRMRSSWESELCYLVIHGILHLFDYSDYKPKERSKMFAVQDRLFKRVLKNN